jgi:hypothetical protein
MAERLVIGRWMTAATLGAVLVAQEGDPQQAFEERIAALANDSFGQRLAAVAWLVQNQKELVPGIAKKIHGQHREYQLQIERLLQQLTDDRWLAREEAERTLSEIGGKARAVIEKRKTGASLLEERLRCERILRALDARGMAKEETEARILRGLIGATLQMQPDPKLREGLLSALGYTDPLVVEAALRALSVHGQDDDAELLAAQIKRTPAPHRSVALAALPRLRGARALEECAALLQGGNLSGNEVIDLVRGLHGRQDAQPLLAQLQAHADPRVGQAAQLALAPAAAAPRTCRFLLADRSELQGTFLGVGGDGLFVGGVSDLPRLELPLQAITALTFPEAKSQPPAGCRVFLNQGTLLHGDLNALDAEGLTLTTPHFGHVRIPRSAVQGLALDPRLDRMIGASSETDRTRLENDTFVTGRVEALRDGKLQVVAGAERRELPLADVAGLLFQRPPQAPPDPLLYTRIELVSGDRLLCHLANTNAERLGVVVPGIGSAAIPLAQVTRIEFGIGGGALWGFTLIADYSDNRVLEVDEQGKEVFVIEEVYGVWDAECLDNGNLLLTEFQTSRVAEITRTNQVVWEYTELRSPNDADRLPNGNTLIADTFRQRVIEVSKDKKIVWEYRDDQFRPFDADRLPNGNTLICDLVRDRVIEVSKDKNIVWEAPRMASAYDADRLANGNTLITLRNLGKVVEVDRSGKVVWQIEHLNTPSDADRLPNGNTIVAENLAVREFDRNGNVVWKREVTWAVEVNRY